LLDNTVTVVQSAEDERQLPREDVYEETRKIEADVTFSKQRETRTTADTSQGLQFIL